MKIPKTHGVNVYTTDGVNIYTSIWCFSLFKTPNGVNTKNTILNYTIAV
jgi:hypothetical protein